MKQILHLSYNCTPTGALGLSNGFSASSEGTIHPDLSAEALGIDMTYHVHLLTNNKACHHHLPRARHSQQCVPPGAGGELRHRRRQLGARGQQDARARHALLHRHEVTLIMH